MDPLPGRSGGSADRPGNEVEIALVIAAADPRAVAAQVADLTEIARYRLIPRGTTAFHDVYVDTPEGTLDALRWALRLREIDGITWITLKGPSTDRPAGGITRWEVDRPWSADALEAVLRAMRAGGAGAPVSLPHPIMNAQLKVLHGLGFVVVQDRETWRTLRDVLGPMPGDPIVAELSVDAVTYHLPGSDVRHFEVEVEARSESGEQALGPIAAALIRRFAPALRHRTGSKLAIGKAIARLHGEGTLESLLGPGSTLTPAAYDVVAAPDASSGATRS